MTFKLKRPKPKPKLNKNEREQADKAAEALRTVKVHLRQLVDRTRVHWNGEPNRSTFGIALDPALIRFFFSVMAEAGAVRHTARAEAATLEAAAAVAEAVAPGGGEPPGEGAADGEAFKKFLSENAAADKVSREGIEAQSPGPSGGEPGPLGDCNPGPSGGDLGPEPGGG